MAISEKNTYISYCIQFPGGKNMIDISNLKEGSSFRGKLAVRSKETPREYKNKDGKFSLESVRCLGCCGLAPVITVDGDVYRRVNPKKVLEVLQHYE